MCSCGPLLSSPSFSRISNGVACLSRLAVVRVHQKIYYFSLSPRRIERVALLLRGGKTPNDDARVTILKCRQEVIHYATKAALARPTGSLLGLENTPLPHLPLLGPSHRRFHPSLDTARRDIASEHRLDKRFCIAIPTDLGTAIHKYYILFGKLSQYYTSCHVCQVFYG